MLDRKRLAGILAHLGDAEDATVLVAARKAAKAVAEAGMNWEQVVGGAATSMASTTPASFNDALFKSFGVTLDDVERVAREVAKGFGEGLTGSGRSQRRRRAQGR